MQTLLRSTIAYQLLAREAAANRLANTYLLLFNDRVNLRFALKEFACLFFDGKQNTNARIGRENHPDCLFYPEAGKSLDKDNAAAIVEESVLSPVEGKRKLFVLDNMHRANPVAQNKLLKVLEEPPEGVYFLLGATTEYSLLATVKSRAEKLEIPPFSEERVAECLKRLRPDLADAEAAAYASASGGSVGRAQELTDGGKYAELMKKAFDCVSADCGKIAAVSRALNGVEEKAEMLSMIRRMYRDMLFYRTGQPYAASGGMSERLKALSAEFTPAVLIFALDTFAEAEKQIMFNANLSQCVEVGLWKIDKEKQKCKK